MLIQQRTSSTKKYPNYWGITARGMIDNEDVIRELDEELGIKANKEDLKLQEDEVQDVKWVSIKEFENIVESGNGIDTRYFIFKEYYEKFYNRYVVFEDDKPVYKNNRSNCNKES